MDNIVERLRNRNTPYGWNELADKAADEIERLRAERASDQQRLFHYEATIERLSAQLDNGWQTATSWVPR